MGNEFVETKSQDEERFHKPVMIFGKDVTEIKCFRNSMICGICIGVVGGLASFLVTSKTLFSTHMSFASLWIGVFAYWIPCRYQYETKLMALEIARKKLKMEISEENSENENAKENAS